MSSHKILDIDSWARKKTYQFFKNFEFPFFNMTASVDVTALKEFTQSRQLSFFLTSLHCAVRAANEVECFRYRIKDSAVICYDTVHAGSTVLYDDKTFGFCYFNYQPDILAFCADSSQQLAAQMQSKDLDPRDDDLDMLHFSIIPWVSFTSFQHARRLGPTDSVPKIVFGKYSMAGNRLQMPVSVEVHHALMDGYAVGLYFQRLQKIMNSL